MNRRDLLGKAGAVLGASAAWASANDRIRVAVMGMGGRGGELMTLSSRIKGVEIAAVCDPDEQRMRTWATTLEAQTGRRPRAEPDVRRILDDKNIDALIVTCCNHWHALAGIWSCQAGKHVYVEKPVSHNVFEGRKLVEAARKYNRCVQGGIQNRSNHRIRKAIKLLHEGIIGPVYAARWVIAARRDPIGVRSAENPPQGLHWDLWLGPGPEQPFHRNLVHYNWHWFWDFGNGEMGNNGTHFMDVARWGLGVKLPEKVHSAGTRYGYHDQAQTPHTQSTTFEYPDGRILTCDIRGGYSAEQSAWYFYGSEGSMTMGPGGEFQVFWKVNKSPDPVRSFSKLMDEGIDPSTTGVPGHLNNFYSAIRTGEWKSLNGEIEELYLSCALCHLANISYRCGQKLRFRPDTERFDDAEANELLSRQYRKPFEVPERV